MPVEADMIPLMDYESIDECLASCELPDADLCLVICIDAVDDEVVE